MSVLPTMRPPFILTTGPCTVFEFDPPVDLSLPTGFPVCTVPSFTHPDLVIRTPEIIVPDLAPPDICRCITYNTTSTIEVTSAPPAVTLSITRVNDDCCQQVFNVALDITIPPGGPPGPQGIEGCPACSEGIGTWDKTATPKVVFTVESDTNTEATNLKACWLLAGLACVSGVNPDAPTEDIMLEGIVTDVTGPVLESGKWYINIEIATVRKFISGSPTGDLLEITDGVICRGACPPPGCGCETPSRDAKSISGTGQFRWWPDKPACYTVGDDVCIEVTTDAGDFWYCEAPIEILDIDLDAGPNEGLIYAGVAVGSVWYGPGSDEPLAPDFTTPLAGTFSVCMGTCKDRLPTPLCLYHVVTAAPKGIDGLKWISGWVRAHE